MEIDFEIAFSIFDTIKIIKPKTEENITSDTTLFTADNTEVTADKL